MGVIMAKRRFKEKISKMHKFSIVFPFVLVTVPFYIIMFINPDNFVIWPGVLGWTIFAIIMLTYYWLRLSSIVFKDDVMMVPNRGYHRDFTDVRGKVAVTNGPLKIPYKEILEITEIDGNIQIGYQGISNPVVLHPVDLDDFIYALQEKLKCTGNTVPINLERIRTSVVADMSEFKNRGMTNWPTLIVLIIFFGALQIPGIYDFVRGNFVSGLVFTIIMSLVTFIFFVSVFFIYKCIIKLSDIGIVIRKKMGDAILSEETIPYENIVEITRTKQRVDIKSVSSVFHFIINGKKQEAFCAQLKDKMGNSKFEKSN